MSSETLISAAAGLNALRDEIFQRNVDAGWWSDLETGQRKERNFGELLALVHSELSEALEGYRKNLMDDHLPHRKMVEVELADTLIRIFDMAGGFDYDLTGSLLDKLEYNRNRADHKIEARKGVNGKKI